MLREETLTSQLHFQLGSHTLLLELHTAQGLPLMAVHPGLSFLIWVLFIDLSRESEECECRTDTVCSEEMMIYIHIAGLQGGHRWVLGKRNRENSFVVEKSESLMATRELGKVVWKIWHWSGSERMSEMWLCGNSEMGGRGSAHLLEGMVLAKT